MEIRDFPSKDGVLDLDLFFYQDSLDNVYKKTTKAEFLAGIGSGGSGGSGATPWLLKNGDYTAIAGNRLIVDTSSGSWLLTLPSNPNFGDEIEIYGMKGLGTNKLNLDIGQKLFKGNQPQFIAYSSLYVPTNLIYLTDDIGWIDTNNLIVAIGKYPVEVLKDLPFVYLRLNDLSGPVAKDLSANNRSCQYQGAFLYQQESSLNSESGDKSVSFGGVNSRILIGPQIAAPAIYVLECKFKTTSLSGGLFGFYGSGYDRDFYLTNGKLTLKNFNGATITTPLSYNDNLWHVATATTSSRGAEIFVDGVLAVSSPSTAAASYTGNWFVGYGHYGGYFKGLIDEVSITHTALSVERIKERHAAAL